MKIRYLLYILLLLFLYFLGTKTFIWTTQIIYTYVPRTENMHCLVFKTLRDPIQRVGTSLNLYNSGIMSVFTLEYLYAVSLAFCLTSMMILVEIAALMGAVVLLAGYAFVYILQVIFITVLVLSVSPYIQQY